MANVLGELFGNIALAIREKTGETATMKPAEFPEKIRTIETGGGSAGGGMLPAGLYWQQIPTAFPYTYTHRHFKLGDSWYLVIRNASGSGSGYTFYRYENNAYTQITAVTTLYAEYMCMIEYHGKLHFLGSPAYHHTWDGKTFASYTNVPISLNSNCAFVLDDTLYCLDRSTGLPYYWDESADTWAAASGFTAPKRNINMNMFTYGGELYGWATKAVYKLQPDKSWLQIGTLTGTPTTSCYLCTGDYLYYGVSTDKTGYSIYKFDMRTFTDTLIGVSPFSGGSAYLYAYNGQIRMGGGSNTYPLHLIMHEISA